MNELIEVLKYTTPSLITGGVAAYFLKSFIRIENSKRNFKALAHKKETALPIRLQAYERMTLFLERIHVLSITQRLNASNLNKIEYAKLLINTINAEFEHNLVQQIYVSAQCWDSIKSAKETVLNNITALSMHEELTTGDDLKTALRKEFNKGVTVIDLALQMIQKEVHQLL